MENPSSVKIRAKTHFAAVCFSLPPEWLSER